MHKRGDDIVKVLIIGGEEALEQLLPHVRYIK